MADPLVAVRDVVRRARVHGPDRATLDGHDVAAPAGATSTPPVLDALSGALYQAFHAGLPWPPPRDSAPPAEEDVSAELTAANAGVERWEEGWSYVRPDRLGRAVARRDVALRAWWPGHWVRTDGIYGSPHPGVPLRVLHPAAPRAVLQEGFWFAYGAGGPDDERVRLRVYLNLGAGNAAAAVRALTARLHRLEVPFHLKVAALREALAARLDSAVLYVEARHFRVVMAVVVEMARELSEPLGGGTPPLAKPLLPGVAVAEDPPQGESFGMERSRVLAEGLWRAARDGAAAEETRLDAVASAFAERGLDLERPWLRARGVPDPYELAAA